jgi:stage V sporulation protein B
VAHEDEAEQEPKDQVKTAGRGGLAVGAAKVFFLLVGFVQQVLLARVLGTEGYGALSRVLALGNIANNVVIAGGIQGASREIAGASETSRPIVQRKILSVHAALSVPLALLFFVIAPLVAERTGGAHVVLHLRVLSLVVLAYTVYAAFVGVMNGRQLFVKQASVDVLYATLRTAGLLGGGYLLAKQGFRMGALGSILGFAGAALLIVPVAARLIGLGSKPADAAAAASAGPDLKAYLGFLARLALVQLLLNALMQADITLLGRFASDAALRSGLTGDLAAKGADKAVAIYRACQLFSFLPYQLLFAITFILFPMLAKAHADGDRAAMQAYIKSGTRLAFLFGGAIVAVTVGLPNGVLHLAFVPQIADPGASVLRVLALGQGAFALFGIATTVLNSTGHERATVVLNVIALLLVGAFAFLLVPGTPLELLPHRMALAVALALLVAMVLGGGWVRFLFGALIPPLSAIRIGLALALAAFAGSQLPAAGKVFTLASAAVVGVVYLVVLLLSRELTSTDLALVKRVVGRGKAS